MLCINLDVCIVLAVVGHIKQPCSADLQSETAEAKLAKAMELLKKYKKQVYQGCAHGLLPDVLRWCA